MTTDFDTSGTVNGDDYVAVPRPQRYQGVQWRDISPFTQGYIEAAWSAVIELRRDAEDRVQMNLEDLGFRHLAPETLARIIADCEAWIAGYTGRTAKRAPDSADMGREFWRIRQTGRRSTFPPLTVQLGDDGKVRFA